MHSPIYLLEGSPCLPCIPQVLGAGIEDKNSCFPSTHILMGWEETKKQVCDDGGVAGRTVTEFEQLGKALSSIRYENKHLDKRRKML